MTWDSSTIAAFAAFIAAIASFIQSIRTHQIVNSRMSEMLALAKKQASDEATLAEKLAEHTRKGEAAIATVHQQQGA